MPRRAVIDTSGPPTSIHRVTDSGWRIADVWDADILALASAARTQVDSAAADVESRWSQTWWARVRRNQLRLYTAREVTTMIWIMDERAQRQFDEIVVRSG